MPANCPAHVLARMRLTDVETLIISIRNDIIADTLHIKLLPMQRICFGALRKFRLLWETNLPQDDNHFGSCVNLFLDNFDFRTTEAANIQFIRDVNLQLPIQLPFESYFIVPPYHLTNISFSRLRRLFLPIPLSRFDDDAPLETLDSPLGDVETLHLSMTNHFLHILTLKEKFFCPFINVTTLIITHPGFWSDG
jgi:hypothetical protein